MNSDNEPSFDFDLGSLRYDLAKFLGILDPDYGLDQFDILDQQPDFSYCLAARTAYIEMLQERRVKIDLGNLYKRLTSFSVYAPGTTRARISGGQVYSLIPQFLQQVEANPDARGTKTFFGSEVTSDFLIEWIGSSLIDAVELRAEARVVAYSTRGNKTQVFEIMARMTPPTGEEYEVLIPVMFLDNRAAGIIPNIYGRSGENLVTVDYEGGRYEFR